MSSGHEDFAWPFCDQSLINTRKQEKTWTVNRGHCAQPDDLQLMSAASASRRQCACYCECRDNRHLDQVLYCIYPCKAQGHRNDLFRK